MNEEVATRAEAAGAPSANGELLFEEPWEGRVLSMAVHLSGCGAFAWDDFRARLIGEIAKLPEQPYYVQFLSALEDTLLEEDLLVKTEISERMHAIAQVPDGHHS